ncbi:MAG: DNA recombination protein RmuC [Clostridiaceae bacterium]|nr:DNA recombination protein RmuC [Clostridia bacterium]MDY3869956.1 DNA recombination protein RmuC [Clostridiaceae bacterium]
MELYLILAALAAVVICLVLLLQQNSRLRRMDDLEQQVLQLQSLLQEGQKGEAALQARQDLLMHSVDGALEKLQARQAESALLTEQKLDQMRRSLTESLDRMQGASQQQLETIRKTVDEKLQQTLERKLNESFRQVSQQLEQVYKGLGEMQSLASGVGDLKKVLSNVKTRGVLGEIQLGAILEQLLTPEQYATNVATKKGSAANVEYAIRLPGSDGAPVWLPIDAKFPLDAYEQVLKAYDTADAAQVESAVKQLKARVKSFANDVQSKYIDPPNTTDFAILFIPVEGLYAELVRAGMVEELQRDYKVTLAGPTTMSALLNSLQMGFRTLAIQKRSGEVWKVLGAVKTAFENFATVLESTQNRLNQANAELDKLVGVRTRQIQRTLKNVESLPVEGILEGLPEEK